MFLTLRQWVGHATLSSPEVVGRTDFHSLTWLVSLSLLAVLCLVFQGPRRFLVGLIAWSEFRSVFRAAITRIRKRLLVPLVLMGCLLLSWTTSQLIGHASPSGLEDLQLSLRTKTVPTFSLEQGFLAALIPLRDLTNLADVWFLVLIATLSAFYFTNAMQWIPESTMSMPQKKAYYRSHTFWIAAAFWLIYRIIVGVASEGGLPLITGAFFEIILEPIVMLFIDSMILSWVIVDLRDAETLDPLDIKPRMPEIASLMPAIFVVQIAVVPARYAAHFVWTLWNNLLQVLTTNSSYYSMIVNYFIWFLGDGMIYLQMIALPFVIMTGAVAYSQGSIKTLLRTTIAIMRYSGSTVLMLVGLTGLLDLVGVWGFNMLLLSHPAESWVLAASDSYAHYLTLLSGLVLISALIELAARADLEMQAAQIEK